MNVETRSSGGEGEECGEQREREVYSLSARRRSSSQPERFAGVKPIDARMGRGRREGGMTVTIPDGRNGLSNGRAAICVFACWSGEAWRLLAV